MVDIIRALLTTRPIKVGLISTTGVSRSPISKEFSRAKMLTCYFTGDEINDVEFSAKVFGFVLNLLYVYICGPRLLVAGLIKQVYFDMVIFASSFFFFSIMFFLIIFNRCMRDNQKKGSRMKGKKAHDEIPIIY